MTKASNRKALRGGAFCNPQNELKWRLTDTPEFWDSAIGFRVLSTTRQVVRGGSFVIPPKVLRSAHRFIVDSEHRHPNFGFRILRLNQGERRVLRSGSFFSPPEDLRSTHRVDVLLELRFPDVGFRCVRVPARPSLLDK